MNEALRTPLPQSRRKIDVPLRFMTLGEDAIFMVILNLIGSVQLNFAIPLENPFPWLVLNLKMKMNNLKSGF